MNEKTAWLIKNVYLHDFGWKIVSTFILILTAAATFVAYAAFIEPTAAPSASDQDFAQNILGANDSNNDFDSSSVAANADGSIVERLVYITTLLIDYSLQKNGIWDDWKGSGNSTNQGLSYAYTNSLDQNEEEAAWTSATDATVNGALVATGEVVRDGRTKLYWSDCYTTVSDDNSCDAIADNNFSIDGSIADTDDGLDAEGGTAVDFCEALSLDADGDTNDETDWYLPSQKEIQQAYVDGAANNYPSPGYVFWSSTVHSSTAANAWGVRLNNGTSTNSARTLGTLYAVCVRR